MNNIIQEEATGLYEPYTTTLPSQETYQEINDISNPNTEISLRAAPPGGNPIGGVPLDSPSLVIVIIPFLIYFVIRKITNNKYKL